MIEQTVDLTADLTFETVVEQRIRLHHFIKTFSAYDNQDDVIINLAKVKRSDSAGLALLVDASRMGRRLKKKILFTHIPEQMMSMISFCNLLPLFIQEK